MIEVELPDGTILEFPAGTDEDTMRNAVTRFQASRQSQTDAGDLPSPAPAEAAPEGEDSGSAWRGPAAFLSGANRGLASVLDAPVKMTNWVLDKAGAPEEWRGSGVVGPTLDYFGAIREPDPEYPTAEAIGEGTGAGIATISGMGLLGALGKGVPVLEAIGNTVAPAMRSGPTFAAGVPASEALATAGSMAGGSAGQSVGEYFGGDVGGAAGRLAGSLAGSVLAPSADHFSRSVAPRKLLARAPDEAMEVSGALRRSGIDPSMGLTGGRTAEAAENVLDNIPVLGAPVSRRRDLQARQFGDRVQDIATTRRGGVPSSGDLSRSSIGQRIQDMADEGLSHLEAQRNQLYTDLGRRVDKVNSAVDVTDVKLRLHELMRDATPDQQNALLKEIADLDTMRTTPIDANVHKQLTQRQAVLKNSISKTKRLLQDSPDDVALKQQLRDFQAEAKQVAGDIDANLGVRYGQMKNWRTSVGKRVEQGGVEGGQMAQTYKSATEATEDLMSRAGALDDYRDINAATRELHAKRGNITQGGDIPELQKLKNKREGRDAFAYVFDGKEVSPERIELLYRNSDPARWDDLSGDIIEYMGKASAGQKTSVSDFSPNTFLTNWNRLPPEAKRLLAGDEMQALDDLAVAAQAFRDRAARGNPSGTARMLQGGASVGGLSVAATRAAQGDLSWLGAATLGAGATNAAARAAVSKGFNDYLGRAAPKLASRLAPRLVGQAGREMAGAPTVLPEDE